MIKIPTHGLTIYSWDPTLEQGAVDQARNLALHPYAHERICVMPDGHQGFGMPIGGVAALKSAIIPNAVGYDIGCGMRTSRCDLTEITKQDLIEVLKEIRTDIPVGFSHRDKPMESYLPKIPYIDSKYCNVVRDRWDSAAHEIGTLGGGNHFIEIQKGDDGHIYVTIHSGSRNVGQKTAKFYNDLAKEETKSSDINIPKGWQLDVLTGDNLHIYFSEMNWCLEFARANRFLMMETVQDIMERKLNCEFESALDIHHNYASLEMHYGNNYWIHRKGATAAEKGLLGIIPGSQGSPTYIVKGRGNESSFSSCSHGAGRKMGREVAKKTLKLDEQTALLDSMGIMHSVRGVRDLDEAPGAYKDIDAVMALQQDLVSIENKLIPIAVVKG